MKKNQYNGKFSDVYDSFLEKERIEKEVLYLESFLTKDDKRILDVGCGTGNHSINFAKKKYYVVGYDPSEDMIEKAKLKSKQESVKVNFFSGKLEQVDQDNFDFCCSMFHVVNHITEEDELLNFFKNVEKRLSLKGRFVFDAFNLSEVERDPPREKQYINGYKSSATYNKDTNLMEMEYFNGDGSFKLVQRIWGLNILKEMLKKNNLKIEKMYKWYQREEYEKGDYKITFLCAKFQ